MDSGYEYAQMIQFGRFRINVSQKEGRRDSNLAMQYHGRSDWSSSPIDIAEMREILRVYDHMVGNIEKASVERIIDEGVPF